MADGLGDDNGRRPIPDPTVLTTQQLLRELAWLREVLETRLNGMDKAIELLQKTTDMAPARMDEKIKAAISVHDQRFESIVQQFSERDVRGETSKRDSKDALDAALAAQKEAAEKQAVAFGQSVAKSESSTDKRIDQISTLVSATAAALEGKVADVKERVGRIEARGEGQTSQKTEAHADTRSTQANLHLIVTGVSLLFAIVMGILAVFK